MRHVSEGDLHAYLDDALELYAPEEARWVREHLASCPACSAKLDVEASLRATASAILEEATPGEVAAPPLEELRRRAEEREGDRPAPPRSAAVPRRVAWAWAATVVLALGVGWGVGGFGARRGTSRGPSTEGLARPSAPSDRPGGPSNEAASATGREVEAPEADARQSGEAQDLVASAAGGSDPAASKATAETDAPVASEGAARLSAASPNRRASREQETPSDAATPAGDAVAERLLDQVATTSPPVSPLVRQESAEPARGVPSPSPPVQEANAMQAVSSAAALSERAISLAIPGLAVEGVEWTSTSGQPAIRVLQRREDGAPVELRFVGVRVSELEARAAVSGGADVPASRGDVALQDEEASPPGRLLSEPLRDGWSQVVLPFRGGWVVARSPLGEAELRALVEGIR